MQNKYFYNPIWKSIWWLEVLYAISKADQVIWNQWALLFSENNFLIEIDENCQKAYIIRHVWILFNQYWVETFTTRRTVYCLNKTMNRHHVDYAFYTLHLFFWTNECNLEFLLKINFRTFDEEFRLSCVFCWRPQPKFLV